VLEYSIAMTEFIRLFCIGRKRGNVLRDVDEGLVSDVEHGLALRCDDQLGFGAREGGAAAILIQGVAHAELEDLRPIQGLAQNRLRWAWASFSPN